MNRKRDNNEMMRWLIPPWWHIGSWFSIWRIKRHLRRTRP